MAQGGLPPRAMRALDLAFEITSVVPLGAFVLLHVGEYAQVLAGATAVGARRAPSPSLVLLEAMLVWLPLAFHSLFGVLVWHRRRSTREPVPAGGQGLLALHRLSALFLAAFLVHHFVRFRLPILQGASYPSDSVQRLAGTLSTTHVGMPVIALFELFGVLAASYHVSYGLFRVGARRGLDGRRLRIASAGLGSVLGIVAAMTVVRLAAG